MSSINPNNSNLEGVTKNETPISDSPKSPDYPPMKNEYKHIYDLLDPIGKMDIEDMRDQDRRNQALARVKRAYDKTGKIDRLQMYEKTPESSISYKDDVNKIAIIIPFRESDKVNKTRTKQLNRLVEYFSNYLNGYNYMIFVIQQTDDKRKFNRGALLNIGFLAAQDQGCNVFIFHDVDLLPSEELKEYYINPPVSSPVHIAAVWDRYGKNPDYFGGIVVFNRDMFNKINGTQIIFGDGVVKMMNYTNV